MPIDSRAARSIPIFFFIPYICPCGRIPLPSENKSCSCFQKIFFSRFFRRLIEKKSCAGYSGVFFKKHRCQCNDDYSQSAPVAICNKISGRSAPFRTPPNSRYKYKLQMTFLYHLLYSYIDTIFLSHCFSFVNYYRHLLIIIYRLCLTKIDARRLLLCILANASGI